MPPFSTKQQEQNSHLQLVQNRHLKALPPLEPAEKADDSQASGLGIRLVGETGDIQQLLQRRQASEERNDKDQGLENQRNLAMMQQLAQEQIEQNSDISNTPMSPEMAEMLKTMTSMLALAFGIHPKSEDKNNPILAKSNSNPFINAVQTGVNFVASSSIGQAISSGIDDIKYSGNSYYQALKQELSTQGITDPRQQAYIMATAKHETGNFQHTHEIGNKSYFNRYIGMLGNRDAEDAYNYRGRGLVQLTGRSNYQKFSKILGIDLVGNPDLATKPEIAAKIMVTGMKQGLFTGKGLDRYINGNKCNFEEARRTVNGTDRAGLIAGIAHQYLASAEKPKGNTLQLG
jgi:predicted chitinase